MPALQLSIVYIKQFHALGAMIDVFEENVSFFSEKRAKNKCKKKKNKY